MAHGGVRWGRVALLIGGAIALYILGRLLADMFIDQLGLQLRAHNEPLLHRTIMAATVTYVALMSIPFMPGVEIGLSLLMVFGARISFLVYVSTVLALTLAFLAGRLLPAGLAARILGLIGLSRAHDFVRRLEPLSIDQRVALLVRHLPGRWAPYLARHRYLALAVLLNLPGNIVIGGGGGIALLTGMTRLFSVPGYVLTVALAVAPVPLFFFVTA